MDTAFLRWIPLGCNCNRSINFILFNNTKLIERYKKKSLQRMTRGKRETLIVHCSMVSIYMWPQARKHLSRFKAWRYTGHRRPSLYISMIFHATSNYRQIWLV